MTQIFFYENDGPYFKGYNHEWTVGWDLVIFKYVNELLRLFNSTYMKIQSCFFTRNQKVFCFVFLTNNLNS